MPLRHIPGLASNFDASGTCQAAKLISPGTGYYSQTQAAFKTCGRVMVKQETP